MNVPSLKRRGPPIVPVSGWAAWAALLTSLAMGFLAVLTITVGLAANRLAETWREDLAGAATVRVPPGERVEERLAAALEVLRTSPGVAEARALTDEEQAALLAPWLGGGEVLADLPAPRLIDVRVEGTGPDPRALADRFALTSPGASYDDHGAWRVPLAEAAATVETLAITGTALVTGLSAIMVAMTVLSALSSQTEIVRTVRLIGGEDRYITGAFVYRMAGRALAGAAIGTIAAIALVSRVPAVAGRVAEIGVPETGIGAWVLLGAAVPLAAAVIAWTVTQATVRIVLRRRS